MSFKACWSSTNMDFLLSTRESLKSVFQNISSCSCNWSSSMRIKLTFFSVSPLKLAVGPISVHPNGDLTAHGSPRLPCLIHYPKGFRNICTNYRSITLRSSILAWKLQNIKVIPFLQILFLWYTSSIDQTLGMVIVSSPSMSVTWSSTSIPFLSRLSPFNVVNEDFLLTSSGPNLSNSPLSHMQ